MAIYRVNKTKDYTTIAKYHLREKEMSLKAKGLLTLFLSLPDDWNYSVNGITEIVKESKNTVNDTMKELENFNYLKRTRIYENGKVKEWQYDIYEKPNLLHPKIQDIEIQDIEIQDIENEAQLNTKELSTKELNTKEIINSINSNKKEESIFDFVEKNFGRTIAPIEIEKLHQWQERFSEDMLKYAIELSVMKDAKNFKYIEGIINNWTSSQFKTLADVKKIEKKEIKPIDTELFEYDWLNEED